MNKTQKIIAGIVALIAFAGIVITAVIIGNRDDTPEPTPDPVAICPIENDTVIYNGIAGETALTTLKNLCEVTMHPSYDGFVTAIAGREAGDTYYWAFYVNDDYATEGAGTYKAKEGDEIRWVLTSLDTAF